MAQRKSKWVKRWEIQGSGEKPWIVAMDGDGNYGCSCPRWKFHREECHHIKQVKMGTGTLVSEKGKPKYVLAKVNKPIYDSKTHSLLIPLIGIPDAMMMEATICYYMLRYGYSMAEIRQMRKIPQQWSAKVIYAHIEQHGEAEYPEGWYKH